MVEPDTPYDLPAAHGVVAQEGDDDEGEDGTREHRAIRGALALSEAASRARPAARAARGRFLHEGEHDDGRHGRERGAEVEDRVEAVEAAARQVIQRRRERRSDDQAPVLRRRQDPIRLAAVALWRDVGDEGLACRADAGRPDSFEQTEENEPEWVRRRREQQHGDGGEGGAADDDGLPADRIAQPAER